METIINRLENITKMAPDLEWFFPDTDKTIKVHQLKLLIDEYSTKFQLLGIKAQEVVGLTLPNSLELVAALYACWKNNYIAVPLRTKSGKYQVYLDFLIACHQSCNFKLMLCANDTSLEMRETWQQKTQTTIKTLDEFVALAADQKSPPINQLPDQHENDLAIIQFSSGSTGFPKGVMVTHNMVMRQLEHIYSSHHKNYGEPLQNIVASWTPINHDMGLFTGVLYPIFSGSTHILASPEYYMQNPSRWFKLLAERKVELSFTTNSALAVGLRSVKRLYNQPDTDLSKLHMYISAEKISSIVLKKARELLAPLAMNSDRIHVAYGMAENSLGASVSRRGELSIQRVAILEDHRVIFADASNQNSFELVSSGYANPMHDITVRNVNDEVVDELILGEVNIESNCMTPGYMNMPEKTAEKFIDGRFRTGDLGFMWRGELYFYSRKDDLIVYNGRNIVPEDIEETVESLDFVRASASALLAWESSITGTMILHLLVEGRETDSAETMEAKCKTIRLDVLEKHDVVLTKIYLCAKGTIEKTSSGKKRRKVLTERLKAGQLEIYTGIHETA